MSGVKICSLNVRWNSLPAPTDYEADLVESLSGRVGEEFFPLPETKHKSVAQALHQLSYPCVSNNIINNS